VSLLVAISDNAIRLAVRAGRIDGSEVDDAWVLCSAASRIDATSADDPRSPNVLDWLRGKRRERLKALANLLPHLNAYFDCAFSFNFGFSASRRFIATSG
jgi:hypothetical protein